MYQRSFTPEGLEGLLIVCVRCRCSAGDTNQTAFQLLISRWVKRDDFNLLEDSMTLVKDVYSPFNSRSDGKESFMNR